MKRLIDKSIRNKYNIYVEVIFLANDMLKKVDIAVIGGGAAGFASAICASYTDKSLKIAIFEKGTRVARKILATGNGRCNISNRNIFMDRYHGQNVSFAENAFNEFDFDTTMEFFKKIGVLPTELEDGKMYPMSLQAASVVDMLRIEAQRQGIAEVIDFEVVKIKSAGGAFEIASKKGEIIKAKKVILCTGGKAAPEFGTDGSAYKLATDFGHKLTPLFPALVQLKCDAKRVRALKGVKLMGNASLISGNKTLQKEYGEVMFTDYGLSGPPIFQLSRKVAELLNKGNENIKIKVDLIPEYNFSEIEDILFDRRKNLSDVAAENFLNGMLNKQIARQILKESDEELKLNIPSKNISDKTIKTLAGKIKGWEFEVIGTNPWKNAQVTAGGIETDFINPDTMESEKAKGLYLAGEILDIDGDCGGFNLQWAWSSGFVAGKNAALSLKR